MVLAQRCTRPPNAIAALRALIPAMLLAVAMPLACFAETYEEMLKKTDQTNAQSVYELAEWCQANNQPTKYRQLLAQVIRIDRDHEAAREALGQVKVGSQWVSKSQVKDSPKGPPDGGPKLPSGTGPAADKVSWDLTIARDPQPKNPFVGGYIAKLNSSGNDSSDMEIAISTLTTAENFPMALPRLQAALLTPEFKDLYGPSAMIQALLKSEQRADAKALFPFIVVASARSTDSDDLQAFTYACAGIRDKRAMARLLELMASTDKDVANSATEAAAAITGLPVASLDIKSAQAWWARHYASDDSQILKTQLLSKDPETSIAAAAQLGAIQDKKAVDVLIEWMKTEDPKVAARALQQVAQFTGRDWGYVPTDPLDARMKRVAMLSKWWKENRDTFKLQIDQRLVKGSTVVDDAGAPAADPQLAMLRNLSSTDSKLAAQAENDLLGNGEKAVPVLLTGLTNDSPITVRTCNRLLQQISKKNDISVNPRDTPEARQKAIAAWRTWATDKKLVPLDGEEEEAKGGEETDEKMK